MTLPTFEFVRVRSVLRHGNSLPVVAETSGGTLVVKLRGAAQGILPLVAEVIVAHLARLLGLPVPELALVSMPAGAASDDRNDELRDLLDRSVGLCLGVRFLPGAREIGLGELDLVPSSQKRACLWLDGWVENLDRTRANPNVLVVSRAPWFIDHGSSLSFHYDLASLEEDTPKFGHQLDARHLFADELRHFDEFDAGFARLVTRDDLQRAAAAVPDDFLASTFPELGPARARALYVAYLWKRLKTRTTWIDPNARSNTSRT